MPKVSKISRAAERRMVVVDGEHEDLQIAVPKVLRVMPQGELKPMPKQTAYSAQVREAPRRLPPK